MFSNVELNIRYFQEKANLRNEQLINELFEKVRKRVIDGADHPDPDTIQSHFNAIFKSERQAAFDEVCLFPLFFKETIKLIFIHSSIP